MKLLTFLRWLFRADGITKVHPSQVGNLAVIPNFIGKHYHERKCGVCGEKYWSYRSKEPKTPVCTTWFCFRDWYLNSGKRST